MRSVTLKNQGAPIDIIVPTDGVGFDLEATAIMRGTRNLAAAQRLADWTVSPRRRRSSMAATTRCWRCRASSPPCAATPPISPSAW